MAPIDEIIERYNGGIMTRFNRVAHILGVLLSTVGLMAFLWHLPSDIIKSWLGNNYYANWATVYAVLMIIYFGSESFSLTFAGGFFYQGCLFLIDFLETEQFLPMNQVITILLSSGFILMLLGHIQQRSPGLFKKDLTHFIISPVWIFRFIYRWFGISF